MKKGKSFNPGDKVFAKVKGYPAWPAQVVAANGKKYDVKFFGTGETGCLKGEDLFYFLKHKKQFIKSLKRKDYNDAIEEIENEIKRTGSDHAVDGDNTLETTVELDESIPEEKGTNKRKRSLSSTDTPNKKGSGNKEQEKPQDDDDVEETASNQESEENSQETNQSENGSQVSNGKGKRKVESDSPMSSASPKKSPRKTKNEPKLDEDEIPVEVKTIPVIKKSTRKSKLTERIEDPDEEEIMEEDNQEIKEEDNEEPSEGEDIATEEQIKEEEPIESDSEADTSKEAIKSKEEIKDSPKSKIDNNNPIDKNEDEKHEDSISEDTSEKIPEDQVTKDDSVIEDGMEFLNEEDKKILADIILIPDVFLTTLTAYANKLRENREIFKKREPDIVSLGHDFEEKSLVLPVKLPSGKYIGIKYIPSDLSAHRSEFDRALADEKLAKEIISTKMKLEAGKQTFEDNPAKFISNLSCSEAYLQQKMNLTIVKYKKHKLEWLQNESELIEKTIGIKKSLGLEQADPKKGLKLLEEMANMKLDPIILKKHSNLVEMVKRLMRYIGNVELWDMSEEELQEFQNHAKSIREVADKLYEKIKGLFTYGTTEYFFEKFLEDVETFKKQTKDMKESEVFSLCAEPYSRRAILDQLYDSQHSAINNED